MHCCLKHQVVFSFISFHTLLRNLTLIIQQATSCQLHCTRCRWPQREPSEVSSGEERQDEGCSCRSKSISPAAQHCTASLPVLHEPQEPPQRGLSDEDTGDETSQHLQV